MYPIPPDMHPKYELGTMIEDTSFDDISVIVDVYVDENRRIMYIHRDISDITRELHSPEIEISEWFKVL